MVDDTRRYLDVLFADAVSDERRIAIWDLPSKRATFHGGVAGAVKRVAGAEKGSDVYCGVGLYRPGIKRGRGKAGDVVSITSLWADIDYGKAHKKPGIPPDPIEASKIIDAAVLRPTMVVSSGHGYHAYWSLAEPLDNGEATTLARGWGAWLAKCASDLGYVIDSVFDLSRVLRVPGTTNHKGGDPLAVSISELDADRRYQPDDFEMYLPPGAADVSGASAPVGGFRISRDAYPDAKMLDAALANDLKFKRTWEQRRSDFADQSPSAYDMSLAIWAAQHDLTDQQAADLIIGFRTKHGHNLAKVCEREDYLGRTIARARDVSKSGIAERQAVVEHVADSIVDDVGDGRADLIASLRGLLGIPIAGFIKRGRTDSRYAIILESGDEIAIGTAKDLLAAVTFRHAVYDQTQQIVRHVSRAAWDGIVRQLTKIMHTVEMPDGDNVVESWLGDYLVAKPPIPEDSWPAALATRMPFERDGGLYVHLPDFRQWVTMILGERETAQNLRASMHRLGFVGKQVTATIRDRNICRWYWSRKRPH